MLHIERQYTETGGGICKGQEGESWPSYNDSYREYTYGSAYKKESIEPKKLFGSYESIEVEEEIFLAKGVYLAIAVYSDGGTFQTTRGYEEILGLFLDEKTAKEYLDFATDDEVENCSAVPDDYRYRPWSGYFASLMEKKVIYLEVK